MIGEAGEGPGEIVSKREVREECLTSLSGMVAAGRMWLLST